MNSLPFKDDMENMQDMDILDMNVLDEAENDNSMPAEEEYDTDEVLNSPSDEVNPEILADEGAMNEDEHNGISGSLELMSEAKPEEVRQTRCCCGEVISNLSNILPLV